MTEQEYKELEKQYLKDKKVKESLENLEEVLHYLKDKRNTFGIVKNDFCNYHLEALPFGIVRRFAIDAIEEYLAYYKNKY